MGRQESTIICTNIFQSSSEKEKKRRFIRLWIQMINKVEKSKSAILTK
ncbi:MAG: hypothetical protein IKY52_00760 [Clostridia bacterium]|nr:hypothetical protein [Clostridia bacterium]